MAGYKNDCFSQRKTLEQVPLSSLILDCGSTQKLYWLSHHTTSFRFTKPSKDLDLPPIDAALSTWLQCTCISVAMDTHLLHNTSNIILGHSYAQCCAIIRWSNCSQFPSLKSYCSWPACMLCTNWSVGRVCLGLGRGRTFPPYAHLPPLYQKETHCMHISRHQEYFLHCELSVVQKMSGFRRKLREPKRKV